MQLNRHWLHESIRITRCKASCKILFSGEEVWELGAKGTNVLLQSSRFWPFYPILHDVHGVCGCARPYALALPSFLHHPTEDFVWPKQMCLKYSHLQAGSMQEETIFHWSSFCALEGIKYFKYDNRTSNKKASNLQHIFRWLLLSSLWWDRLSLRTPFRDVSDSYTAANIDSICRIFSFYLIWKHSSKFVTFWLSHRLLVIAILKQTK